MFARLQNRFEPSHVKSCFLSPGPAFMMTAAKGFFELGENLFLKENIIPPAFEVVSTVHAEF